ncbi:MAG: hypothetical protein C7B47_01845 [Sulfobacillus thermosulfidooxidans]|uniref:Aldose 1-epimerase n=1 Tax=Sulfobacillus thermosulfidooxidans TaxID=28034 RepID=A0A2T2X4Q7_SULTH|nr:MAG: hypothetical protein C7B47_01845 [Sulfobacillus thermosulfidooxidans]
MGDRVHLENSYWAVTLWPQWGATIGQLIHVPSQHALIRGPLTQQNLDREPYLFGMPLLFPAGRIADGQCHYGNEHWQWPRNDTAGPNHLHGFLWNKPFDIQMKSETQCVLTPSTDTLSVLTHYMHQPLAVRVEYALTQQFLKMRASFTNLGRQEIPFGFGYHLNICLTTGWQLSLPSGRAWIMGPDLMPVRLARPGELPHAELLHSQWNPRDLVCDMCYTVSSPEHHVVGFEDADRHQKIWLHAFAPFGHWVLYRPHETADFISVEPYTWVHNAPHLPYPPKLTGWRLLKPGETVETLLVWESPI